MSQSPYPFAEPPPSQSPSGPTLGLAAIIAICLTLLLMCGGVLGLGFYAVNRLAAVIEQQIEELSSYDYEEDEAPLALRYALADVPEVRERIGQLRDVEINDGLTYDRFGSRPEYFYDVTGDQGAITVAVSFSHREGRWFSKIALVDDEGTAIGDIDFDRVPFDSGISHKVWERICDSPELTEKVGAVRHVSTDWTGTTTSGADTDFGYRFAVRGEQGTAQVEARFTGYDFEQVAAAVLLEDDGGEKPLTLAPQPAAPESPPAPEPPPAPESPPAAPPNRDASPDQDASPQHASPRDAVTARAIPAKAGMPG